MVNVLDRALEHAGVIDAGRGVERAGRGEEGRKRSVSKKEKGGQLMFWCCQGRRMGFEAEGQGFKV